MTPDGQRALPTIAIAICTFDRPEPLTRLLAALAGPKPEGTEIYVVNNGPGEHTRAVSEAAGARYVRLAEPGLSRARNAAIDATREDYVHFLDDDVIVPADWLTELAQELAQHRPEILGAPIDPDFVDGPPPDYMPEELFTRARARPGWNASGGVSGGNFAVRRDVFAAIGGFRDELGMTGAELGFLEEYEFVLRWRAWHGRQIPGLYFSTDCSVGHAEPATKIRLRYQLRRSWKSHRQRGRLMATLSGSQADLYRRSLSLLLLVGGLSMTAAILVPKHGYRRDVVRALISMTSRVAEWLGARSQNPLDGLAGSHDAVQGILALDIADGAVQLDGTDPYRASEIVLDAMPGPGKVLEIRRQFVRAEPVTIAAGAPRKTLFGKMLEMLGLIRYAH